MHVVDLAKVAYEAYVGDTDVDVADYKDLPEHMKQDWRAVAQAVAREVAVQMEQGHTVVGE